MVQIRLIGVGSTETKIAMVVVAVVKKVLISLINYNLFAYMNYMYYLCKVNQKYI